MGYYFLSTCFFTMGNYSFIHKIVTSEEGRKRYQELCENFEVEELSFDEGDFFFAEIIVSLIFSCVPGLRVLTFLGLARMAANII